MLVNRIGVKFSIETEWGLCVLIASVCILIANLIAYLHFILIAEFEKLPFLRFLEKFPNFTEYIVNPIKCTNLLFFFSRKFPEI